jgi:hypothetical protein
LTSNKNNSQQPNQQENVNKYTDFFPGFKLQQEQYNKVKTNKGKSWPRAQSPLEKRYQQFISDVVNPSNNCFYTPLDENNYPVEMPDKDPRTCRHVVNTIIRIKTFDGSEKLYSLGTLIGYDGASIRRTMACEKPEVVESVRFGQEKKYNSRTRRFYVFNTGPVGLETKYLLDFNQENFDSLYQKTWDGKNEYFKPNKRNSGKRITLIVKDEATNIAIEVFWQSTERSVELMKTKPFEELFNGTYLPPAVREERIRFSQGYMEEQQKTSPTTTEKTSNGPDIKNTNAYK